MKISIRIITFLLLVVLVHPVKAQQVLTLKDAVQTAVANYGTIKAKGAYARASAANVSETKREALPNLVLSAQQDYGTINGTNGPAYGFGGYAIGSSGAALASQNYNASFGGLYLTNVNWDFFAFGRARQRVNVAQQQLERDQKDQQQEIFQHEIRVAGAYLSLLAAQRITQSERNNLNRADTFKHFVVARALNGLQPGVDSSQAAAEVSAARIELIRAQDAEDERANQLAILMGVEAQPFVLDSLFITKIPLIDTATVPATEQHPLLQYYKSRVGLSDQEVKYLKTFMYPTFSLVGIYQGRGSGFESDYTTNQAAYSSDYYNSVKPTRGNYLFGVGITWNLTSILRVNKQVATQRFTSEGLQAEYDLVAQQITAQQSLASTKITNAVAAYNEAPIQVKAASDAYLQRSVLYKNGLSNIVDVTQALYVLNRAETDRDVAYANVWQALLLKAASAGDFAVFANALQP